MSNSPNYIENMEKIANQIKAKSKKIYVFSAILFVLTLFIGIWWLIDPKNNHLEPLTYVLGGLCTISGALPKIAEFIIPVIPEKALRDMSDDEILNFILATNPITDWRSNQNVHIDERFLKNDIRLRIVSHSENDLEVENFIEDWANSFPNPNATSYSYNILYDGHFIKSVILVYVDGNRASLPLPDIQTRRARDLDYKVAQIFNNPDILENYMIRANILI